MIYQATMQWDQGADDEVSRLSRGDSGALAGLIGRYQHRLYRYLLRMVRQPVEAEDLFQQTWLRVMEKIGRYDAARGFDTWLFCLAHNLAMDHLRRRRAGDLDENLPAAQPSALDQAIGHERARMLEAALARLPAPYRETLSLRFEEGLKLEEIAEISRVPLSTVKSQLRRGLEAVRAMVGETR